MTNHTAPPGERPALNEIAVRAAFLAEQLAEAANCSTIWPRDNWNSTATARPPIEFMTVTQVAEFLGVCRGSVYRYHDLPYVKVGARRRYRVDDVRAWARTKRSERNPSTGAA